MTQLIIRLIGNHWYPCVNHNHGDLIALSPKIERYFNIFAHAFGDIQEIVIDFEEIGIYFSEINAICFNEEDIMKYYTSNDYFLLKFTINNHEFEIDSYVFSCIEEQLNLNFCDNLYKLHIR